MNVKMRNNTFYFKGKKLTEKHKKKLRGHIPWMKGKHHSKETKKKISKAKKGFKHSEKSKRKIGLAFNGKNHWNWQGGLAKSQEHKRKYKRERRHRLGISKKYNSEINVSYTKEYKKFQRQKRKALVKGGGKLSIKTIQMVYEDNIKKYGTLSCIYCLKSIEFGKDTLEHKTPLSRGGNNDYENLAIACRSCNGKKHNKTYQEFIAIQNGGF